MFRRFPLRFRNLIYFLTGLCVLSFQGWWLHDGYTLRRKALLDEVSTQVRQFQSLLVIQRLAPTISINGTDTSEIELGNILAKDELSKADTQKLLAARKQIERGASSISFNISTSLNSIGVGVDSQLYYLLRDAVPSLRDSAALVVFHKTDSTETSFPRGASVVGNNGTGWVESESRHLGSIDVRIPGLPWIIFRDMVPAFLFTVLYLCLFIWTILALLRTVDENRRLLESKANFTQNMTHELKIPISGLFLATEALTRFDDIDDPQKARKHLTTIRNGLHQLSTLVDRILNTARLEQRQVRLQRSVIHLKPLLVRVLADMSPLIEAREASVTLSGVDENATVYADPEQLRYVFFNLIDNAIKYTLAVPAIGIVMRMDGAMHLIEISDNGIGIEESYRDRIFEAYFRVPQQDRHDVKGFGLGLNIVRQIVRLHDGNVSVVGSGTDGTTIQIQLPRHDA